MMVRLYKTIHEKVFYKECWQDDDKAIIHRGVVGNEGIIEQVPCPNFEEFSRNFSEEYYKQGYTPLCAENSHIVIVTYQTQSSEKAQQISNYIIPFLNEKLGWVGLGYVDGYDISVNRRLLQKAVLQIFCVVIDREIAERIIKKDLSGTPFSKYSVTIGTSAL